MTYTCLKFNKVKASGTIVDGKWKWEPVVWERCRKGVYHSNRDIPHEFWNKYNKKKKDVKNSAGILIWKSSDIGEKKFFMVQSYGNFYGIPKGTVEDGETFFDGALREFYEETGTHLNINQKDCFEVRKHLGRDRTSIYIVKVPWYYDIKTFPLSDVEISSFGFIKKSDLKLYKLNSITKDIFRTMMNMGNEL